MESQRQLTTQTSAVAALCAVKEHLSMLQRCLVEETRDAKERNAAFNREYEALKDLVCSITKDKKEMKAWKDRMEKAMIGLKQQNERMRVLTAEPQEIPLRVVGHRANYKAHKPSNVLQSDNSQYFSAIHSHFTGTPESDWIVFGLANNQRVKKLESIKVRNDDGTNAVKHFKIEVSNDKTRDDTWVRVHTRALLNLRRSADWQEITWALNELSLSKDGFRYIRLSFVENHGLKHPEYIRFALTEMKLFGVC